MARNNIGKQITKVRIDLDMKQKDMAEALGIAPNWLSLIECGRKEPSIDLLNKIAELYDSELNITFKKKKA